MFFRLGFSGLAALAVIIGVVVWGELTAPVPQEPCPALSLATVQARSISFGQDFAVRTGASDEPIVRALHGQKGLACFRLLRHVRCEAEGALTVGVAVRDTLAFYEVPAGRKAEITVAPSSAPACGLAPIAPER